MKNKRVRNISIFLLCIILFIYLAIGINSIISKNKLGLFSLKFYIMSSDSTEANKKAGDLIVAENTKVDNIKENDYIIYQKDDELFIKKVIKVDSQNGKVNLYIENDNVLSNEKMQDAQIMGKVLFSIKGLGNVALFIQSPLGTLNVFIIMICIFIIVRKISKTIQDDKEDVVSDSVG